MAPSTHQTTAARRRNSEIGINPILGPHEFTFYVEASGPGKLGPGGWGLVTCQTAHPKQFQVGRAQQGTTHNELYLRATIEALGKLPGEPTTALVKSGSEYLVLNAQVYSAYWQRNGWLRADGQPVKHPELWAEIARLATPHFVDWQWHPQGKGGAMARHALGMARAA